MKKILYTIITITIISTIGAGYYWYFYIKYPSPKPTPVTQTEQPKTFSPFDNSAGDQTSTTTPDTNLEVTATSTEDASSEVKEVSKLRQLSVEPIAGMAIASSTESMTVVRFVDRGTGHVYEADSVSNSINKISNTTVPKTYEAYFSKGASSFIVRYLKDDTDIINNFYAELRSTGTSTSVTPFNLKGKFISSTVDQITVSPTKDKIFTWNIEAGRGVGYISNFDEKAKTKVIDTPFTQAVVDWPEANTVTVATKASGVSSGFIYTVDTKSGVMKSLIGNMKGLSGKMSHDLSKVIYSASGKNNFLLSVFSVKDSTNRDVVFKTLSDKCVWSNLRKDEVYCAVPTEIPDGLYPDDWYKGNVSFIDQIWHLNTTTGEVHLLSDLVTDSNKLIDATNLVLDPNENFLYFTNKKDLNLWELNLNL